MLGIIVWLIVLPTTFFLSLLIFTNKNSSFRNRYFELRNKLGKLFFDFFILLYLLIWIIPYNGLIIFIGIIFSHLFEKKYLDESKSSLSPKIFFTTSSFFLLIICAFIPVSVPESPIDWEDPIVYDDSRVNYWPASSQSVWLLDRDLDSPVVVTVLHQRVPGTICPWKVDMFTSWFVESLHIDEKRLEETALSLGLDPENFRLENVKSEGSHLYRNLDSTIEETLTVSKRKIITDFPFSDTVVGELITVYKADWGGELWAITITQVGSYGSIDPWAEEIILEWLEFRINSN